AEALVTADDEALFCGFVDRVHDPGERRVALAVAVPRDDIGPIEETADRLRELPNSLHLVGGNEAGVDRCGAGNTVDALNDLEGPAGVFLVLCDVGLLAVEGAHRFREVLDAFLVREVALREHAAIEECPHNAFGNATGLEAR